MFRVPERVRRHPAITVLSAVIVVLILAWISIRPRNDRNWTLDQRAMPSAEFGGDMVHVRNIRDFTYASVDDYVPRYRNETYDLRTLRSVWFVAEPFADWDGPAHTFLSFGFEDGRYLAVSAEIRKEINESFFAWKGLLKRYELMYVVGTERDLVGLRTNHYKDDVYLYPLTIDPGTGRKLLVSMLERANALHDKPEFYHTLANSCTTNIIGHMRDVSALRFPMGLDVLLPARSDRLAYDLQLIDTDLSFESTRERFRINDDAAIAAGSPNFSRKIRERFARK